MSEKDHCKHRLFSTALHFSNEKRMLHAWTACIQTVSLWWPIAPLKQTFWTEIISKSNCSKCCNPYRVLRLLLLFSSSSSLTSSLSADASLELEPDCSKSESAESSLPTAQTHINKTLSRVTRTFTCMHLAGAFIHLQCIQAIHFSFISMHVLWELTHAMLKTNALPLSHKNTTV